MSTLQDLDIIRASLRRGAWCAVCREKNCANRPSHLESSASLGVNQMAKMCEVCGKQPVFGNKVSHAHNVSSRRWLPNLQRLRVKVAGAVRRINVCTRCIRSNKVQKAAR